MSEPKRKNERLFGALALIFVVIFAAVLFLRYSPWGQPEQVAEVTPDAEPVPVVLELEQGAVEINLRPDLAPKHVEQLTTLIEQDFYDGIVFHRVIEGFMAQTGDPTGTGTGSSDLPDIPAEFSDVPFERGTVGMARAADPNSANSQFFIMFAPAPSLNGQYTVIGEVTSGMEYVDQIEKGDPAANGMVQDPDTIVSMRLAEEE